MVPPDLPLEIRGWILHQKRDRDGDQKLLWPFEKAENAGPKAGKGLGHVPLRISLAPGDLGHR